MIGTGAGRRACPGETRYDFDPAVLLDGTVRAVGSLSVQLGAANGASASTLPVPDGSNASLNRVTVLALLNDAGSPTQNAYFESSNGKSRELAVGGSDQKTPPHPRSVAAAPAVRPDRSERRIGRLRRDVAEQLVNSSISPSTAAAINWPGIVPHSAADTITFVSATTPWVNAAS